MTEKEIIKMLKGQQLSEKNLLMKAERFTTQEKAEFLSELEFLIRRGIVGRRDSLYYFLRDQGVFLAEVFLKTHNFVVLKEIPSGDEVKISGQESSDLLPGDLVYVKEFQKGVFHCIDYLEPVSSLKGRYSLAMNGDAQLLNTELNKAGKTILIDEIAESLEVRQGDFIRADITNVRGDKIFVKASELLVSAEEVGSDISMIISEHDAPLHFPEAVMEEAKNIPSEVTDFEKKDRTDFRSHTVVTIDGDDAHDFDDAVEAEEEGSGYCVRVHIADVTHYVRKNHPIDDEAERRGTSIYVADRVVPMLPFELSNGICSLNPGVDRLTLTVTMHIDPQGHVFRSKIERGLIRSAARLTYSEVNEFLKTGESKFSSAVQKTLNLLSNASKAIRRRRELQGAMNLESTELKFKLDEEGTPTEVEKISQGESEKMIEDLMIVANCTVAKALRAKKIPVLYRVHEFPPLEKLSNFREYLRRLELASSFPKNEYITGGRLNDFLASIEDVNVKENVSRALLRAMAKAEYSPEEIGHFGLAELYYCHFTSPIRRYPDDMIHRLVKDYLIDEKSFDYDEILSLLYRKGQELSAAETRAVTIEREVEDLESAKYMAQHIGDTYEGKIVSMIRSGMFVETEIGIEGFLAYHCMHDDYFHFNENYFEVVGRDTDISFTLGTPITIKVLAADPQKREVDFATPKFYDRNAVGLSLEERKNLSLNGIHIYLNKDEENNMEEEYIRDAMKQVEDQDQQRRSKREGGDDFRPTPEQWKEVDVIRAVVAKYPDDEKKVIDVLAVMDISEEEYRKLLRFTKPREDKPRGRGKSFSPRGEKKFPDHKGYGNSRGPRSEGGRGRADRAPRRDDRRGGHSSSDRGRRSSGFGKRR